MTPDEFDMFKPGDTVRFLGVELPWPYGKYHGDVLVVGQTYTVVRRWSCYLYVQLTPEHVESSHCGRFAKVVGRDAAAPGFTGDSK